MKYENEGTDRLTTPLDAVYAPPQHNRKLF